jgi:hypothetical protein
MDRRAETIAINMKILFHVNLRTMLRHFDSVILALADRGHSVRIASSPGRKDVDPPAVLTSHDRITFIDAPDRRTDQWAERIVQMRVFRDYLRYLDRQFDHAPKLRTRAARKFATSITDDERTHLVAFCARCSGRLVDDDVGTIFRTGLTKGGFNNLRSLLALMEDTVPTDAGMDGFLSAERPDVLVITPLIKIGSSQPDFVKSARKLGIPTVYPVFSWDNLSTKGLIHVQPDNVIVWNERQRREAVEMHQVPYDRVVVTGAPRFDEFFAMTPATSRDAFCTAHRLDPRQPIVSYLCSSEFVSGHEREFVERWIEEIRRAPALRSCNVLIRPHPRRQQPWKEFVAPPRVAVAMPQMMNGDQTLYDSVHHSAAVVGLNTSAELEAGIVGRPVLTMLVPEFSGGQQGTLHFNYLLKDHGGFVEVAHDFDSHRQQLTAAVAGGYDAPAIRAFIREFLRPHGLEIPATTLMADAIEALSRHQRPELIPAQS